MHYREDTSDWNTISSVLDHDEYHLRGLTLMGLAIDVGAHCGAVTVALAVDNPGLHVIAVEPLPDNVRLLRENTGANGIADRVTIIPRPVGRSGDTVTVRWGFQGNETALHHAFIGNSTLGTPDMPHDSAKMSAVGIVDLVGQGEVAFLKIDCEGGEWGFLDDPAVSRIALIVGEYHPVPLPDGTSGRRSLLEALLTPTHDLEVEGPEAGLGAFRAVRR